jgi:hypothetical protein
MKMTKTNLVELPGTAHSDGNAATIWTVSTLTRTSRSTSRTMYSGSSSRLGSVVMPERLSVETWYWSMTQSIAMRLPRQ